MGQVLVWDHRDKIEILVWETEDKAVMKAVSNLSGDIKKTCGCEAKIHLLSSSEEYAACMGHPGKKIIISTVFQRMRPFLVEENLHLENMYDCNGELRWEAYAHHVKGKHLFILGSGRRGTIYGIYDLSSQLGVSPWYYWADVPVKRRERFVFPEDYHKVDWPSVAYRGIFINDEEELDAWAKLHTADGTIGPETYEKVYELILRLKGNYLWPAMHVNYFNENPENGKLAHEMGIVIGTSHCDMLLRSNQNEWKPWVAHKGYENVKYDYSIPGRNREILTEYWKESVQMNQDYEVCYTVGMRGIHDYGFQTSQIDGDSSLDEKEKQRKRIDLLGQIIKDQRKILCEVLGEERGRAALQSFVPYKEVLPLYDDGLEVPEDITLIWVDDNFGHVRRYPNEEERARKGGNGLYFHASYWAFPGMSYLFINSIPLAHIGNELQKCYESGIQKMWVLNVGAIKPLEQDIEFFLQYGWEAGKEHGDTKDAAVFTQKWIDRNFSGGHGKDASEIYNRFVQITNVRKLEHLQTGLFMQTGYVNEGKYRVAELKELYQRGNKIYDCLPENEKEAFFQMFLMKIHASYYINAAFYFADRSRLMYDRGAMQAADHYLELSRKMDIRKRKMLHYYNHRIANGKWAGILTPESFSPPPMALYPEAKPALVIGQPELGVVLTEGTAVQFFAYGQKEKHIELFNKGCGSVYYRVNVPDWILADSEEGWVSTEHIVTLRIREEWAKALFQDGREGQIQIDDGENVVFTCPVKVQKESCCHMRQDIPIHMNGDGYCVIPADQFIRDSEKNGCYWKVVPYLGRGEGNVVQSCSRSLKGYDGDLCLAPRLEYYFAIGKSGAFTMEFYRLLTLNSTGTVCFAVSVDSDNPVILSSDTTDEWKGNWEAAVMNNGEKMYWQMPFLQAGTHVLKLYMIDRYIAFSKIVIYTEKMLPSNLGPLLANKAYDHMLSVIAESADYDLTINEKELSILPMLYADQHFWEVDRLYLKSDEVEQDYLGEIRYHRKADGTKDIPGEFGEGIFMETQGRLAIEAEYALENSVNAYLTGPVREWEDSFHEEAVWAHTQAETDGGNGLAMILEGERLFWRNPYTAPGMHYRFCITNQGLYHVWMLVRFKDDHSDSCYLALDGTVQPLDKQFSGGNLFTYSMKQRWNWQAISDMEFSKGNHVFSVLGRKSGLQIDRIYITKGMERPPVDKDWKVSERLGNLNVSQ